MQSGTMAATVPDNFRFRDPISEETESVARQILSKCSRSGFYGVFVW